MKHEDLTRKIIGSAMEVHNEIGHGLREKTYERALCKELSFRDIAFSQQSRYDVLYPGEKIDEYIPDLVVENTVIVEMKTVEKIADEHIGQVINYLRISGLEVGLIINFKHLKLQWKRVLLDV